MDENLSLAVSMRPTRDEHKEYSAPNLQIE
jgi:hypothetical protein